jgi:hypothetical protein
VQAVKVLVGIGRSRRQVIVIGRSPVWLTYCPVPKKEVWRSAEVVKLVFSSEQQDVAPFTSVMDVPLSSR